MRYNFRTHLLGWHLTTSYSPSANTSLPVDSNGELGHKLKHVARKDCFLDLGKTPIIKKVCPKYSCVQLAKTLGAKPLRVFYTISMENARMKTLLLEYKADIQNFKNI